MSPPNHVGSLVAMIRDTSVRLPPRNFNFALLVGVFAPLLFFRSAEASCGDWLAVHSQAPSVTVSKMRDWWGANVPMSAPTVPACQGPSCEQTPPLLPLNRQVTSVTLEHWMVMLRVISLGDCHPGAQLDLIGERRPLRGWPQRIHRPPKC
jgi:hypothetical protein